MVSAQDERAEKAAAQVEVRGIAESDASSEHSIYPRWPWLRLVQWVRAAFVEAVVRPLVWLLAHPRVVAPKTLAFEEPVLIIANHVTAYDGPLVQYALPGPVRRRIAAAMAGDMLDDYRHFRNPERPPGKKGFFPPGPLFYLLLTALFNVFPLPRRHNFQRSFAHAGAAMDRGYSVLVFPEGTRSAAGELARFRGGIGLLVKQSGAKVLPVALCGLGRPRGGAGSAQARSRCVWASRSALRRRRAKRPSRRGCMKRWNSCSNSETLNRKCYRISSRSHYNAPAGVVFCFVICKQGGGRREKRNHTGNRRTSAFSRVPKPGGQSPRHSRWAQMEGACVPSGL
jgi:hypothetical protein